MQPTNLESINQKKNKFWFYYTTFFCLSVLCFFISFSLVPRIYAKYSQINRNQVKEFLNYLNETDEYINKINSNSALLAANAPAIFSRLNQLKKNYPYPFFESVIHSYQLRISEQISNTRSDSVQIGLKNKLLQLKNEHETLKEKKQQLIRAIKDAQKSDS